MHQSAAISSLTDLETWFNSCGEKMTFWTLYRGQDTKGGIILRNEHTEDKAESLKMLKDILKGQSKLGGIFFCFVPSTKGGSNGYSTVIALPPQDGAAMGAGASINGIQNSGLPLGIGSLDDYERRLKKEWELEQKIKDLERKSDVNPYIGALMEHPTFDAKMATAGMLGLANNIVEIGRKMAGLTPSVNPPTAARPPINGIPPQEGEQEEILVNGELLNRGCEELADLFPNESPEIIILSLCSYLRANMGMLNMIYPQIEPFIIKVKSEIGQ